jgi:hypothetical protein
MCKTSVKKKGPIDGPFCFALLLRVSITAIRRDHWVPELPSPSLPQFVLIGHSLGTFPGEVEQLRMLAEVDISLLPDLTHWD